MKKLLEKHYLKAFNKIYHSISHPYSFLVMVFLIISWFGVGVFMEFDQKWYHIIHLFEIVVTLLMVFIIESTQQAEMRAVQEKLDEIITKLPHTDSNMAQIEKKYREEIHS